MVKLVGQAVPDDLRGQYDQMVSPAAAGQGADGNVRTRRKVRQSDYNKPMPTALKHLLDAAWRSLLARKAAGESMDTGAELKAEFRRLTLGVFDPRGWRELPLVSAQVFEANPSATNTSPDPLYLYTDANNLLTASTYPVGGASSGDIIYQGSSSLGRFHDDLLRWELLKFDLGADQAVLDNGPVLVQTDWTMSATADERGSKPMLSCMLRTFIGSDADDIVTDLRAPLSKMVHLYCRRRPTLTPPPYWAGQKEWAKVHSANYTDKRNSKDEKSSVYVWRLPRPMFGRGFNNNTSVQTHLSGTTKAWTTQKRTEGVLHPGIVTSYSWGEFISSKTYKTEVLDLVTYAKPLPGYPEWNWSLDFSLRRFGQTITLGNLTQVMTTTNFFDYLIEDYQTEGFTNAQDLQLFDDHIKFIEHKVTAHRITKHTQRSTLHLLNKAIRTRTYVEIDDTGARSESFIDTITTANAGWTNHFKMIWT